MKPKKIILIILIICWMATIFIFSNQASEKSSKTSARTIKVIINKLPNTKNMSDTQKADLVEKLQTPIRKLAHFSIYAIGGILTCALLYKYKISNKNKITFSIFFCMIYAITDEFHQSFVSRKEL